MQKWKYLHEAAGKDRSGNCRSGKCGPVKIVGLENTRVEITAQ